MMIDLAPGWTVELDRGPDWLFVRLHGADSAALPPPDLAEQLSRLLDQQFAHRLVIEMDDVPMLRSPLLGELVTLHKQIYGKGGIMRICGLSDNNCEVLRSTRLCDRFPLYRDREEAVMGRGRPTQPR